MGSSAIETARCRMLWKSLENWLTPEKTWGANNEDVLDGVVPITGNLSAEIARYIRAVNQRQAIPATSPLIFLRLPADNHHVNKESADGKIHLKGVEPRTFKNIGAFSPRFEAADLVGEKSKLLAGDRGAKPFHRGQNRTTIPPGLSTPRNSRRACISSGVEKCSITPRFQIPSIDAGWSGSRQMSAQTRESNGPAIRDRARATAEKSSPAKYLDRRGTAADDSPVPQPISKKIPSAEKYLSRKKRTAGWKMKRRTALDPRPNRERDLPLPSESQ